MHISIILSTQKALIPAINKLIKTLEKKEEENLKTL